jgi:hypothetical protein
MREPMMASMKNVNLSGIIEVVEASSSALEKARIQAHFLRFIV